MGRRELRAELQSSWFTYEPRVAGTPFTEKDLEDAYELERARASRVPDMMPSDAFMRGMLGRLSR